MLSSLPLGRGLGQASSFDASQIEQRVNAFGEPAAEARCRVRVRERFDGDGPAGRLPLCKRATELPGYLRSGMQDWREVILRGFIDDRSSERNDPRSARRSCEQPGLPEVIARPKSQDLDAVV